MKCSPSRTKEITDWHFRFRLSFAGWERQTPPLSQKKRSVCGYAQEGTRDRAGWGWWRRPPERAERPGISSVRPATIFITRGTISRSWQPRMALVTFRNHRRRLWDLSESLKTICVGHVVLLGLAVLKHALTFIVLLLLCTFPVNFYSIALATIFTERLGTWSNGSQAKFASL